MRAAPTALALLVVVEARADRLPDEPPIEDAAFLWEHAAPPTGILAIPVELEVMTWPGEDRPRYADARPPPRLRPTVTAPNSTTATAPPPPKAPREVALPPAKAEAESPDLQRLATRLLLTQWKAEQVRGWFTDSKGHQQWHAMLLEHIARMADLVEGGAEQQPVDPVLTRAIDVGAELAEIALEVMALDYFAAREKIRIRAAVNLVLKDFVWEGMNELEADYRWPVDKKDEAARVLVHARGHRKTIKFTFDSAAAGMAGVSAASFVSGGYSMAQFVGALPETFIAGQAALSRVAAWLVKAGGSGGGGGGIGMAIGSGGASVAMYVTAGTRGAQLVLTEAEVAALVSAGQLTATTGQLVLFSMAVARAATPAQSARAGGMSGTNSVGGVTPPGFSSSQQWDTAANSDRLRRNMIKNNVKFATGDEAHHIVPSTHRRGEEARGILDQFGIDINAAENGVVLKPNGHHGQGLHSFDSIDEVTRLLRQAKSSGKDAVLAELSSIQQAIGRGLGFPPKVP